MTCWAFFSRREELHEEQELLVCPAPVRVAAELRRRPETQITGEYYDPNRKGQDVSEVADIRDYKEGDSLGSIHWKLSGKLDQLVVREFGYPSNYQVLVLCDMRRGAEGHRISRMRNNVVLAVSAALSRTLLEFNLEHHMGCPMGGSIETIPVYSMETHEQMLINLLCRQLDEEKERSRVRNWLLQGSRGRQYTKLIYITPEYDEETIHQMSGEMDVTVVQIVEQTAERIAESSNYVLIRIETSDYTEREHHITI